MNKFHGDGGAPYLFIHDVIPDPIRDPASSGFSNRLASAIFKATGSRIETGMTKENG
ncbi:hypothetical protein [Sphingobium lignivorans]|uniref:Uncharacterized protein n=1 Tax=Sphingobium lignivorans TaxID=2735886 RepID=A0ABR6NJ93_9SPHN|nr:hypothetical protein [Sphingobium lignivorans]MBB5987344.1 hypothetical protein [Sphingobium lignivorans]